MSFWVGAAALLALAFFFVLPALTGLRLGSGESRRLRRALQVLTDAEAAGVVTPEEAVERRDALERQLTAARESGSAPPNRRWGLGLAVCAVLAVSSVLIYQQVGAPYAVGVRGPGTPAGADASEGPELAEAIAGLEAKLRDSPDDPEGWVLLGRSYMAIREHAKALEAFGNARRLRPDEPVVMVDYAEALAFAGGDGALPEESRRLLTAAVERQPDNQKALWLLGMGAFQNQAFAEAAGYWQRLVALLEPGSVRQQVTGLLEEARRQGGIVAESPPAPNDATEAPALSLEVEIAPALRDRLTGTETLFVFARLPEGPRMPLAVKRLPARFPAQLTLSDADAMTPAMKLSGADTVVVSARVSPSGTATPTPGDLQAAAVPVPSASRELVRLVIDEVVE